MNVVRGEEASYILEFNGAPAPSFVAKARSPRQDAGARMGGVMAAFGSAVADATRRVKVAYPSPLPPPFDVPHGSRN
jgi:hypothetical protein